MKRIVLAQGVKASSPDWANKRFSNLVPVIIPQPVIVLICMFVLQMVFLLFKKVVRDPVMKLIVIVVPEFDWCRGLRSANIHKCLNRERKQLTECTSKL